MEQNRLYVSLFFACTMICFYGCTNDHRDLSSTMPIKKIKPVYVFPGTFCPPDIGHLYIVKKALTFLPEVTIVCSVNPHKKNCWFTPQQCKEMWHTYHLPEHVTVTTLAEIEKSIHGEELVMIRGIRDEKDLDEEKNVVFLNVEKYGITKFLYLVDEKSHKYISGTRNRALAEDLQLEELGKYVSPLVLSAMIEKVLHIRNVFMVVGKPGAGKSTFLKMLADQNPRNIIINTDEISHELRPMLKEHFKGRDLIDVALNHEDEFMKAITHPWLELLKARLKKVPADSNVFLEIGYGLEPQKSMFTYVGGKIIYIGCAYQTNLERNVTRGTQYLKAFMDKIPDLEQTKRIVAQHKLQLTVIKTDCSLDQLKSVAQQFNHTLYK